MMSFTDFLPFVNKLSADMITIKGGILLRLREKPFANTS